MIGRSLAAALVAAAMASGTPPAIAADESPDAGGFEKAFADEPAAEEGAKPTAELRDPYVAFYEWATQSLMGYFAVRGFDHFHGDDRAGRRFRRNRVEGEARVQYKRRILDGPVSLIAEVDLRADDDDYMGDVFQDVDESQELRPIVNWNDLYLLTGAGPVDLRLGFQTIGWGTGDLDNPTDNLNPRDLTDLFHSRKIGVLAARTDLYLLDFELQGVYVPFFVASRLPPEGKRFSTPEPPLGALPVAVEFETERDLPRFPDGSQYGARLSRSLGGFDLSASFYSGFNKIPVARLKATDAPPPGPGLPPVVTVETELHFERIHAYGADFATTLGWLPTDNEAIRKLQIHGEAAIVDSRRSSGDDYARYVIGVNYGLINVLFEHDVIILFDWIDECVIRSRRRVGVEELATGLSPPLRAGVAPLAPGLGETVTAATRLSRETRGSLASRLIYKFSESLSIQATWLLRVRGRENAFVRPELIWDMTDNVQLACGADIFRGDRGTFFGGYDQDDRFFFQAKVSF